MIFFAPRYFATCTARRPDVPVAPFTSTVSPGLKLARSFKATHDDMQGIAIAAAIISSRPSGTIAHCEDGTTTFSAMLP
jgi:hypothetical protein